MKDNPTRSRIIDAAEDLFAVHGFDGTSVRAICRAAGANAAAVHYYFQGKEGMAEALFERRMVGLSARRKELLDTLESKDGTPSIHSLVETLALPLAELIRSEGESGHAYVKAFARILQDRPDLVWSMVNRYNADNMDRLFQGLSKALPQLSDELLRQRVTIGGQAIMQCLANSANFATQNTEEDARPNLNEFVGYLVDFIAGGLAADQSQIKP